MNERMKRKAWGLLPDQLKENLLGYAIRRRIGRFKDSRRMFDYDHRLIVNPYLAELESVSTDLATAVKLTGLTIGYPAWNLLYYSLLCSLPPRDAVVVETGTNEGFSTIVMAQAIKDAGASDVVQTVDIDAQAVSRAKSNVEKAGLKDYVGFHVGDSLGFLKELVAHHDHIDFAFLDGSHEFHHVVSEFEIIRPLITACGGKVYFDNTSLGDVAKALRHIHTTYEGNLLEFPNCSWSPSGNAIWQP